MILMSVLVGLVVLLFIRSEKKNRRWMRAFELHDDMFDKYLELVNDHFISDRELENWLPIFEESDRICARDCPDMKFEPISSRIRRIINDEEFLQD